MAPERNLLCERYGFVVDWVLVTWVAGDDVEEDIGMEQ